MGVHSQHKFHTQRRLQFAGKLPKHPKIAHMGNNMEIKILAKNFHLSLVVGSK
jgi:hypothetical protein